MAPSLAASRPATATRSAPRKVRLTRLELVLDLDQACGLLIEWMGRHGVLIGFVPSSFQSSRSQRAAVLQQRAEDLMDDEDRGVRRKRPKPRSSSSCLTHSPTHLTNV